MLGSAALWEGVQCVQAAPSLTSPGSSGWLDSKAAPPRLLAQTAGGRLCLLGHAELSLWGEEGGEQPRETPGTAPGALRMGGEEEAIGMRAPHLRAPISPGDVGTDAPGGGLWSRRDLRAQLPPGPFNLPPPRGCLGWGRGTSALRDAGGEGRGTCGAPER